MAYGEVQRKLTCVLVRSAGEDARGPGFVLRRGEFEREREAAVRALWSIELHRRRENGRDREDTSIERGKRFRSSKACALNKASEDEASVQAALSVSG